MVKFFANYSENVADFVAHSCHLNSPQKGLLPFPDGFAVWVAENCCMQIRCGRCARRNVTYPEKRTHPLLNHGSHLAPVTSELWN